MHECGVSAVKLHLCVCRQGMHVGGCGVVKCAVYEDVYAHVCVCVCVCVQEREREGERANERKIR
jgi:hypothetical protein